MLKLNEIYCMDCIEGMKQLDDNVVDTVIVDVPYGLGFMDKEWDIFDKINRNIKFDNLPRYNTNNLYEFTLKWSKEALRVAKPGSTLLCFGGTRTWHKIACGLEDAGWLLKDTLMWLYGSGFPKSYDISKGIDKKFGNKGEVIGKIKGFGCSSLSIKAKEENARPYKKGLPYLHADKNIYAPFSKEAKEWDGYKSHGLKPAWEPILMCMKPNDGGYVDNALKWGVSGLNIDGGRIQYQNDDDKINAQSSRKSNTIDSIFPMGGFDRSNREHIQGRFPSNVILDETSAEMLDKQGHNDSGGASRFFYVAKASSDERNMGCSELEIKSNRVNAPRHSEEEKISHYMNNHHPTVKPLKLMEYLCNLTKTPKGGLVMDCFCGSGTTLMAAKKTGRKWMGFDNCQEYVDIAKKRVDAVVAEPSLEDWGI